MRGNVRTHHPLPGFLEIVGENGAHSKYVHSLFLQALYGVVGALPGGQGVFNEDGPGTCGNFPFDTALTTVTFRTTSDICRRQAKSVCKDGRVGNPSGGSTGNHL